MTANWISKTRGDWFSSTIVKIRIASTYFSLWWDLLRKQIEASKEQTMYEMVTLITGFGKIPNEFHKSKKKSTGKSKIRVSPFLTYFCFSSWNLLRSTIDSLFIDVKFLYRCNYKRPNDHYLHLTPLPADITMNLITNLILKSTWKQPPLAYDFRWKPKWLVAL